MARGTQHRKRRPPANARVAAPAPKSKQASHPSWEDQLFFSRLRVHAKWVFVFLALAFGLGFVLFGVGSGSGGIGDIMQNFFSNSSSGGSSLSSLQKKARDHPKSATAWRNLATKLEQDQKTDRATISLEHYVKLKPKDESALEELAGLYSRRAQDYNLVWRQVLAEAQIVSPNGIFRPVASSPLGKAYAKQDPFSTLIMTRLNTQANAASQKVGLFASKAEANYKRLVKLAPANATYQFQLAQIAQTLGHKAVAKAAYKTFLKLAPSDSLAPGAKQQLQLLSAPATKK